MCSEKPGPLSFHTSRILRFSFAVGKLVPSCSSPCDIKREELWRQLGPGKVFCREQPPPGIWERVSFSGASVAVPSLQMPVAFHACRCDWKPQPPWVVFVSFHNSSRALYNCISTPCSERTAHSELWTSGKNLLPRSCACVLPAYAQTAMRAHACKRELSQNGFRSCVGETSNSEPNFISVEIKMSLFHTLCALF